MSPRLQECVYGGTWFVVWRMERPPGRKTDWFTVVTKDTAETVAEIRWHGRWRKYGLMPRAETVFEWQCLRELATFMEDETRKRSRRMEKSV